MKTSIMIVAAVLAVASLSCSAEDMPGKQKSMACAACHGEGGHSTNPMYPILAGQVEDYLVHALKAYRGGSRNNAIMQGMAASLSDQDIDDLAAYFHSQTSDLVSKH